MSEELTVVNNAEKGRFEVTLGNEVAFAEYRRLSNGILFPHTEVPPAFEGKGVGGKIVRAALDWARAEGQKVMENLIQAHGKSITAVYAHNDEMALGAIAALKAAGMNPGKDVKVVSVDGQKSALEAIVAGDLNITVECNPRFGPVAFDTYEKFLRGEQIPPKIINQDRLYDASNAAQLVGEAY